MRSADYDACKQVMWCIMSSNFALAGMGAALSVGRYKAADPGLLIPWKQAPCKPLAGSCLMTAMHAAGATMHACSKFTSSQSPSPAYSRSFEGGCKVAGLRGEDRGNAGGLGCAW